MVHLYTISEKNGRNRNQDRLTCIKTSLRSGEGVWLLAVADGIGGMADGEIYADLALREMQKYVAECMFDAEQENRFGEGGAVKELLIGSVEAAAEELLRQINQRVLAEAARRELDKGGATLSACLMIENTLLCLNAGDSPVYLMREGRLSELSVRDNIAEKEVRSGALTRDSGEYREKSRGLYNFIGKQNSETETHFQRKELLSGDILLIGTDGAFGDRNGPEAVEEALQKISSPPAYCRKLLYEASKDTGDNQTLIVAEYVEETTPKKRGLFSIGR